MVSHVISTGLVHGKYYNVYVTQVNKNGLESVKSIPAMVRVGDVTPPVVPTLSMDTTFGTNGFLNNRGAVDLKVKWTSDTVDDDLKEYILYTWQSWDNWDGDGIKPASVSTSSSTSIILQNTLNSYSLLSQRNNVYLYIGIQAKDLSNNASDIYVIKVLTEDTASIDAPANAPLVEGGVWLEKVTITFPLSNEIDKVAIYRDNVTTDLWDSNVPVGYILFVSGLQGTFIDNLSVMDGLSHSYAYAWIDMNGKTSARSPYSAVVTAKAIDTTAIDQETFKALNNAWTSDFIDSGGVADIEQLKSDLATQAVTTSNLYDQLKLLQQNYDGLYNNYTLLVNNYNLTSALVSTQGDTISDMQSSIALNAQQISQKVSQTDLSSSTNQIQIAYTSLFEQNKDSISTIVSNLNNNALTYTSIAQLSNAIQLKVDSNDVISAINLTPEVIDISGSKLHITAGTLFDGNVNINGILNANSIYQAGYRIKSSSMLKGLIYDGGTIPLPSGYTADQCVWGVSTYGYSPTNPVLSTVDNNRFVICQDLGGNQHTANYWIMGVQ